MQRSIPNVTWTLWKACLFNFTLKMSPLMTPRDVAVDTVCVGKYFRPSREEASTNADDERRALLKGAAVLWLHAGGRIMGNPKMDVEICCRLVRELGIPVLSAEYRLAPRHPFPAALDDCVSAWEWLSERDGIDRIVVGGESAGGGLAAELCQRLYDEQRSEEETCDAAAVGDGRKHRQRLPLAQLLVYPMLDDRTVLDDDKTDRHHLVWNNASNRVAWKAYLGPGHEPGDEDLPEYCAAARRRDLSGLPPAWIMVGTLDLFYEESRAYASGLEEAGVREVRFVEIEGGFHGMFYVDRKEGPIVRSWNDLTRFLRRHLEAQGQ